MRSGSRLQALPGLALCVYCLIALGLTWAGPSAFAARLAEVPGAPPDWPEHRTEGQFGHVDLSFLNAPEKPAGRRGFVRAQGDALVFADGTPARFWGTNLTARTLFGTEPEAARVHARRLSELGFNLVRLHHHDSDWVKPNIFGPADPPDTRSLDPAMLARLDWWVKCLKEEGIYVWLDLHVGRKLRAGDGVTGFDEMAKGRAGAELKGYNYVNEDIRRAMQRFNEAYLGHVNPHTGLAYKNDPAIAAVLVTNENDLTHHFGNALLPDKDVPHHTTMYLREARVFARTHGLPQRQVWRAWEPGPSKRFLNDLEHRFNASMIEHLRRIGVKVPIVTTSLWGGQMASLPALSDGDMIDVHAYETPEPLARDPRRSGNTVHLIAAAQLPGKPVSVSEWNMSPFPARDRHILPLYLAAAASHQGWDALLQYAYAQTPLHEPGPPSNWHAFNDPALLASLPAAALLFRRGDVTPARTVRVLQPTPEALFDEGWRAGGTPAMRIAAEQGRLLTLLPRVPELPWLRPPTMPPGAQPLDPAAAPPMAAEAQALQSDTGELRRRWKEGVFTIDTPRTQAALGRVGGREIVLGDVRIALEGGPASVAVQSLDGRPIADSSRLLVSVAAVSLPARADRGPFRTEPLRGLIDIGAPTGLVLESEGQEVALEPGPAARRYRLRLDGKSVAHPLLLKRLEISRP
jgi:hypothetical protein